MELGQVGFYKSLENVQLVRNFLLFQHLMGSKLFVFKKKIKPRTKYDIPTYLSVKAKQHSWSCFVYLYRIWLERWTMFNGNLSNYALSLEGRIVSYLTRTRVPILARSRDGTQSGFWVSHIALFPETKCLEQRKIIMISYSIERIQPSALTLFTYFC